MTLRVTLASTYDSTTRILNSQKADLDRLSEETSSGCRLTTPGDDPLAWSQAMGVKQGLRQLAQVQKNMDFATGWNQATDSALGDMTDILNRAKQVAIQAVNQTSPEQQTALSTQLDQITQEAMTTANSQYGDQYIFSGRSTSTAPFNLSDPPQPTDYDTYYGDTGAIEVSVGGGTRQTVNLDGQTVFFDAGGTSIFSTLQSLKTAIQTGDVTGIQTQEDAIDAASEQITGLHTIAGARLSSLQNQSDSLDSVNSNETKHLSDLQDADAVAVIAQLQQKQVAYQAALSVTAMLKNLNLANYLTG